MPRKPRKTSRISCSTQRTRPRSRALTPPGQSTPTYLHGADGCSDRGHPAVRKPRPDVRDLEVTNTRMHEVGSAKDTCSTPNMVSTKKDTYMHQIRGTSYEIEAYHARKPSGRSRVRNRSQPAEGILEHNQVAKSIHPLILGENPVPRVPCEERI